MLTQAELPRPKAYSYIRMSTEIQLKGDSLRRQMQASKKYAETHGLELDHDFALQDIGKSGYTGENITSGTFGRFLEAVRNGEIPKGSYLLVESFDRMSRQEPIVALRPFMDIVSAGINLVTLDDGRVFSGKISFEDLIISIAKMSRANEESVRKSDVLSKAWENKRNNVASKKMTARCPSWLRLSPDRKSFEIIEERAAVVRRILADAIAGLGAYTIVRKLNEEKVPTFAGRGGWQTSTVNTTIGNKSVVGVFQPSRMVSGKRQAEGDPIIDYFPRIVSDETFYAAQRARLSRRTTPGDGRKGSGGRKGRPYTNLFSKLAICAYCKEPMQYQNKGTPPKGNSYLVCSDALRNNGCSMTGRWRYDHFETAFLSLVEKLDLASLVSSEQHAGKRAELTRQLEVAEGTQKRLERELSVLYDTVQKLDHGSDFLARKIRQCEPAIVEAKEVQESLRQEISVLDDAELAYYSNPAQMTDLIKRVRSNNGADVYRLRAQIASRLQLLIKDLQLLLPLDDEDDDQQFEVNFRDGAHLMVFVNPSAPTTIVKIVRKKDDMFVMTNGNGGEIDRYTMDDASEIEGY